MRPWFAFALLAHVDGCAGPKATLQPSLSPLGVWTFQPPNVLTLENPATPQMLCYVHQLRCQDHLLATM